VAGVEEIGAPAGLARAARALGTAASADEALALTAHRVQRGVSHRGLSLDPPIGLLAERVD